MPTYDYECDGCGHKFEHFQSIKEDALTKCPECKKNKLRRLIGPGAAIMFKGSGFYITDYRSQSYKDAASKDSTSSSSKGEGGGSSGKSDSKGETKSSSAGESKSSSGGDSAGKKSSKGKE